MKVEKDLVQLGSVKFQPNRGYIIKGESERVYLTPRLNLLLKMLLQKKNQLVTREELLSSIWTDVIVSEDSLTKAISDLRKLFKTHNIQTISIDAISKRGYVLMISSYPVTKSRSRRIGKAILKGSLYFVSFLLFVILLIRAIFSTGYST